MSRLTAETLYGIWAGITLPWDQHFCLDEETYAANLRATLAAGVHGVYTTGSTGEFYALDFGEFCAMVDIQAELCGALGRPLQIGCCAEATHKVLRMLEYAASKPAVGAAQVTVPYWMELADAEVLQFFRDLHSACPDLPLVHYNIPRAKRFFHADDYLRILEVAPNLIGVKYTFAGAHFGELQEDLRRTPMLSYFVGENLLISGMMLGARGSCSSLIFTNPRFMLEMYEHGAARRWDQGLVMQRRAAQFFTECADFIAARGETDSDPVFDKGLAVAAGFVQGHQRCRAPYLGWSDETVTALRAWLQDNYPELVYPG